MVRIQALVNGLDRLFPLILRAFDARRRIYLHSDRKRQRGDVIFSRSPAMQKPHTAASTNISRRLAVLRGTAPFSNVATPTFRMAALWFYPASGGVRSAFSNGLHPCRSGE